MLVLGSGAYRIGSSRRVRLVRASTPCKPLASAGYQTHHGQLQPRDGEHRLRRVRPALLRRDQPRDDPRAVRARAARSAWSSRWAARCRTTSRSRSPQAGVPLLGTSAESIDTRRGPHKFRALLDKLGIAQPRWLALTDGRRPRSSSTASAASRSWCARSYVLSGAAMGVAHERARARARFLTRRQAHVAATTRWWSASSRRTPARSRSTRWRDDGELVVWAISEHVENAGVHSGDATLVLPPQRIYLPTMRRMRATSRPRIAEGARHHRPVQHPVRGEEQRRQGDRVQPARLAQLPVRLQGARRQLRRRGDAA